MIKYFQDIKLPIIGLTPPQVKVLLGHPNKAFIDSDLHGQVKVFYKDTFETKVSKIEIYKTQITLKGQLLFSLSMESLEILLEQKLNLDVKREAKGIFVSSEKTRFLYNKNELEKIIID